MIEAHGSSYKFRIPKAGVTLSRLFELVEGHKSALGVQAYSVSETTLEQIFINFAKDQVVGQLQ